MNQGVLGSLLLLASAGLAPAQQAAAPAPTNAPRPAAAGDAASTAAPGQTAPADYGPPDSHPWNPPVGHANTWPYHEPIQAGEPDCGPPGDFWLVGEYLLWGIKGPHLPVVATSGNAVLDGPHLGGEAFSGGRFLAGTWLNDAHSCGIEAGYFFLSERTARSGTMSGGTPVLTRPFTDAGTGLPGALPVAAPDLGPGAVGASFSSALQGAPADLVWEAYCCPRYRVELLGGFRYLGLDEELDVGSGGRVAAGVPVLGGREATVVDQWTTHNVFFGGEAGARAEYRWGWFVGTVSARLALGSDQETLRVVGSTVASRPAPRARPARRPARPGRKQRPLPRRGVRRDSAARPPGRLSD
jgi:hypothetical protein